MPPTASSPPPEPPALPVGGAVFTVHFVRDRTEAIHVMHTGPQPCRATCALFRALCEFVLLFCFESVLLSCSNSPSWPIASRSRCLASVVTHAQRVGHRHRQADHLEGSPAGDCQLTCKRCHSVTHTRSALAMGTARLITSNGTRPATAGGTNHRLTRAARWPSAPPG